MRRSRRTDAPRTDEKLTQQFDNVERWLTFLRSPVPAPKLKQSSILNDRAFTHTGSLEEALDLAERGWPEGIERVEELSAKLSEEIIKTLHVPEVTYDVTGDMLDVGRFVRGEPEDFMTLTPAEIELEPRILHLVVNISASWGVSGGTLIRKGAAVVALVDVLERHGKRVIIDCMAKTDDVETWVRIKESDAPVQLANLVYLLAHPSALRRLMFLSWEHFSEEIRRRYGFHYFGGYGKVEETAADKRGDIYVPGMDLRIRGWDESEAVPWLLGKLSEQGIYAQKEES